MHLHSAPDTVPRRLDDIDLAREAQRAGMGAIMIKCHHGSTVERAFLVSKVVPGIRVYGGLVLNETVGGLNPAAVRLALQWGAKQVWMPTLSARNHRRHAGEECGITVLDPEGRLLPEAEEILRVAAAGNCLLGTAHLGPDETVVLAQRARELGFGRLLVTHPEWMRTNYPLELQKRLAAEGVWFERCFVCTQPRGGGVPLEQIARAIEEVGVASTVLSTDLGQPDTPPPAEGLRRYAEGLLALGFSRDQLHTMMADNPARLLEG